MLEKIKQIPCPHAGERLKLPKMTFCEVVVAEIIGGIVSGLVVALGAYFILDRILIRKAKVRLYIEPNEPVLDKRNTRR